MTDSPVPAPAVTDWHAHVYFDTASRPAAEAVIESLRPAFPGARYGRFHDRPVGPHPDGSVQVAFAPQDFTGIVTHLALHRHGLVVFIHPNTGDALSDHRDSAIWMGAVRPLDLSVL